MGSAKCFGRSWPSSFSDANGSPISHRFGDRTSLVTRSENTPVARSVNNWRGRAPRLALRRPKRVTHVVEAPLEQPHCALRDFAPGGKPPEIDPHLVSELVEHHLRFVQLRARRGALRFRPR